MLVQRNEPHGLSPVIYRKAILLVCHRGQWLELLEPEHGNHLMDGDHAARIPLNTPMLALHGVLVRMVNDT